MKFFNELNKNERQKERLVFVYSVLATSIGFFIGQYINAFIDDRQQLKAFESVKQMILIEAEVNEKIATQMVNHARQNDISYAELTYTVAEDKIKDISFIGFADERLRLGIQQYLHNAMMLNNCRDKLDLLRTQMPEDGYDRPEYARYDSTLVKGMETARMALAANVALIREHIHREK